MRRGLTVAVFATLLGLGMMAATAMPPNPFTGRWESIDPVDLSFQQLQIAPSGQFNLRDTVGKVCDAPVPARFAGVGTFDLSLNTFTATGDVYCLFPDGRELVLSDVSAVFTLREEGTMLDDLAPGTDDGGATWFPVPPGLP